MAIQIYCDGSGTTRSNPGGWGVAINLAGSRWVEFSGYCPDATNNTMELQAAIEGLRWAVANCQGQQVTILTDSEYVINCATKWARVWERNGWKTKENKPAKNKELVERLATLDRLVQPTWQHVRGHSGIEGNTRADSLAVKARKRRVLRLAGGAA